MNLNFVDEAQEFGLLQREKAKTKRKAGNRGVRPNRLTVYIVSGMRIAHHFLFAWTTIPLYLNNLYHIETTDFDF